MPVFGEQDLVITMARLAIFLDGGYIDQLASNEFSIWVDYEKLVREITNVVTSRTAEPLDLLRTYYYHCLPYQSSPPTASEANDASSTR